MSFILEALKKSENERQRTIGPSLADVQVRPRQSEKPWWAIAVGALLVVNLGVLLVVLTRDGDATTQAPAQAAPTVEQSTAPTRNTSVAAIPPPARASQQIAPHPTDPSVRSLADEANVDGMLEPYTLDNPQLAAAAVVPDGPPIVQPIEGPNVAPAVIRPGVRQQPTEPTEVLPTVRDLAAGGTQLPELHLDIHVHSPAPAERFVFVNMRKYIEGQTLSEGPTIERITADGVVLNHQGLRFLLPRQ